MNIGTTYHHVQYTRGGWFTSDILCRLIEEIVVRMVRATEKKVGDDVEGDVKAVDGNGLKSTGNVTAERYPLVA